MKLSAIVLARNEEKNIPDCLSSLSWADEILVVDSGSTDLTRSLSEKYGGTVFEHPLTDFAAQRNYAMQQAKGDWVLFVDADERVTGELAQEIQGIINKNDPGAVYAIPRKTFIFGRLFRFGDAKNDAPVRLFPRQQAQWTQPVHEKITSALPCKKLQGCLLHYTTRDLAHYREKVRDYLPLELITMRQKGIRPRLWNVLVRPAAKFVSSYFWKLGFLDGIAGFQYAILSAYYTFVKHWHYWRAK